MRCSNRSLKANLEHSNRFLFYWTYFLSFMDALFRTFLSLISPTPSSFFFFLFFWINVSSQQLRVVPPLIFVPFFLFCLCGSATFSIGDGGGGFVVGSVGPSCLFLCFRFFSPIFFCLACSFAVYLLDLFLWLFLFPCVPFLCWSRFAWVRVAIPPIIKYPTRIWNGLYTASRCLKDVLNTNGYVTWRLAFRSRIISGNWVLEGSTGTWSFCDCPVRLGLDC